MKRFALALALAATVCCTQTARTQPYEAYNSIGSGFDTTLGNLVQGSSPVPNGTGFESFGLIVQATPFVPSTSGFVFSITLPLGYLAGSGNFNLYVTPSNGAGTSPVDFTDPAFNTYYLGTVTATESFPGNVGALTLNTLANPTSYIEQGTTYWLVVAPADAGTSAAWNLTSPNSGASQSWIPTGVGPFWDTNGAGTAGAMQIMVIPEPGTIAGGVLMIGLLGLRLRQRRASR